MSWCGKSVWAKQRQNGEMTRGKLINSKAKNSEFNLVYTYL